jgi:hypothetical protein
MYRMSSKPHSKPSGQAGSRSRKKKNCYRSRPDNPTIRPSGQAGSRSRIVLLTMDKSVVFSITRSVPLPEATTVRILLSGLNAKPEKEA